jgi:hypothetical protein
VLFKTVFEKGLMKPKETAINALIMSFLKRLSWRDLDVTNKSYHINIYIYTVYIYICIFMYIDDDGDDDNTPRSNDFGNNMWR